MSRIDRTRSARRTYCPSPPPVIPPDVLAAAATLHASGRLEPLLADLAVRNRAARVAALTFAATVAPVVRDLGHQFRTAAASLARVPVARP